MNRDLSGVRIHIDGEANRFWKKVSTVAFTAGQDVYCQFGKFDPNSRTGIELLVHQATHTAQRSRGQVGKGIDPDAGLEQEARTMGNKSPTSCRVPRA
ncbi:eCIS core domain-containing protein [Deinococcus sp. UYEF24]